MNRPLPTNAILTGVSRGIGNAIASRLAHEHIRLTVTARDAEKLEAAAAEWRDRGADVHVAPGDITDEAFVDDLFAGHAERFGPLEALVHSAGIAPYGSIRDVPVSTFRDCLEVNLVSSYNCVRHAVRAMDGRGDGKIVLLGSVRSHWATFGDYGGYPASKFGLRGMVEGITRQLHQEGSRIAVSLVCPGKTDTDMGNPKGDADAMPPDVVADAVLHTLRAPPGINVYDTVVFPTTMRVW